MWKLYSYHLHTLFQKCLRTLTLVAPFQLNISPVYILRDKSLGEMQLLLECNTAPITCTQQHTAHSSLEQGRKANTSSDWKYKRDLKGRVQETGQDS